MRAPAAAKATTTLNPQFSKLLEKEPLVNATHSFRRLTRDFLPFVLLVGVFGAMSGDDPTRKPLGPRAEGRRLLEDLPPIQDGFVHESMFELTVNEQPVGYVVSTVRAVRTGEEIRYAYDDVSVLQGPSGAGTELRTSGILDRCFQPETITWETTHRTPAGITRNLKESLVCAAKNVTLISGDGKGMTTTVVSRPEGRFVHRIGHLFSRLKPAAGSRFMLREFDTEAKSFQWRLYTVTAKPDGRLRVAVGVPKTAAETGYYLLEKNGDVAQHGAADLPFVFKACDRARIEALKKELTAPPPEKAKPQPTSKPTP